MEFPNRGGPQNSENSIVKIGTPNIANRRIMNMVWYYIVWWGANTNQGGVRPSKEGWFSTQNRDLAPKTDHHEYLNPAKPKQTKNQELYPWNYQAQQNTGMWPTGYPLKTMLLVHRHFRGSWSQSQLMCSNMKTTTIATTSLSFSPSIHRHCFSLGLAV